MMEVVKGEVIKLLDVCIIYPISDSPWVSPVQCVPMKRGTTVMENEHHELIAIRKTTEWRMCVDYRKLNEVNRKDHFPLPFIDQILEKLAGNFFLLLFRWIFWLFANSNCRDGPRKNYFPCPYETFAYR